MNIIHMARRSDHTREELRELAIKAGQKNIAEEGFAKFSARKVAREIGYSIGTIYNIFESHDDFILHINAVTLDDIGAYMIEQLDQKLEGEEAIKQLATSYLEFAQNHYNRWSALYEHNQPEGEPLPDWYAQKLSQLFSVVEATLLPVVDGNTVQAKRAAHTVWASIHGICELGLTGNLEIVETESIHVLMDSLIENYMKGLTC